MKRIAWTGLLGLFLGIATVVPLVLFTPSIALADEGGDEGGDGEGGDGEGGGDEGGGDEGGGE
jgi:hypothetical protein